MTLKMVELGVVNSTMREEHLALGSRWRTCPPPDPASISQECFSAAEEAAEQVLNSIHPTLDSEEKRRDVIDYVDGLVKSRLDCEVVCYGSVPLKTYLPDGDIDLTILKGPNAGESLAHDVLALLQEEEQNENAEFQVKDTQFIDAEVKLIKCLIRNIVIDVSFNQLGGLSTLCFLEKVDRFVGRNHLFKRSIILVKTWCYYESRILGAHHGLISTYALETLVLYIFHHFHSSLSGPLTVLYKFLDYYSQFDWENYCISLKGPVCKSSLPDIVVKMPESGCNSLLLSEEFLDNCMELFSVPSRALEATQKPFQIKHLNIIDPLKENNNLGRSVHRGNFYRIRSAFKYGAHKLGQVLLGPRDNIPDGICTFFENTCARYEDQYDIINQLVALECSDEEEPLTAPLSSPVELSPNDDDDMLQNSPVSDSDNENVGVEQTPTVEVGNELDQYSIPEVSPEMASSEDCDSEDGFFVSGQYIAAAKHVLATTDSNCLSLESSAEYGSSDPQQIDLENGEKHVGNLSLDFGEIDSTSEEGEPEAFNPLADLNGDYDSNIRSLLRGQLIHGFAISASEVSKSRSSPSLIPTKKPIEQNDSIHQLVPIEQNDSIHQLVPIEQNDSIHQLVPIEQNDSIHQLVPIEQNEFYHFNSPALNADHTMHPGAGSPLFGTAFYFEGMQNARGTGTYFPHMNVFYIERSSHGRGRNKAPGYRNHLYRYAHSNVLNHATESNSFRNIKNTSHEVPHARRRYQGRRKRFDNPSNRYLSASCRVEFGSVGNVGEEVVSGSAHVRGSTFGSPPKSHGSTALMIGERVGGQLLGLKNEDEFPPLCQ